MNSSKEPVTLTNKFPAAHPGTSNEITDYEQERIFFESGPLTGDELKAFLVHLEKNTEPWPEVKTSNL